MNDLAHVVLGAVLVTVGVLVAALADRLRGLRVARATGPRARAGRALSLPPRSPAVEYATLLRSKPVAAKPERTRRAESQLQGRSRETGDSADDVIAALVAAGYKKPIATESTWACSMAERATVEEWTRAALRAALVRGSREGMS